MQLLDVASRRFRNIPTRFVSGLTRCIEVYANPPHTWKQVKEAGIALFSPREGGSYTIFEERPLDPRILAYCAQDVALIFQLEAAMKRTTIVERSLGDSWDKRILFGSANRVAESKSPNYDGRSRENRAIAPTL